MQTLNKLIKFFSIILTAVILFGLISFIGFLIRDDQMKSENKVIEIQSADEILDENKLNLIINSINENKKVLLILKNDNVE